MIAHQQPAIKIYPTRNKILLYTGLGLLFVLAGIGIFIGHYLFPPSSNAPNDSFLSGNFISDIFVPLISILFGCIIMGKGLWWLVDPVPSLIVTAEGIHLGRNAPLLPWKDIAGVTAYKTRIGLAWGVHINVLGVIVKNPHYTRKPTSMVQDRFSEPIPQIVQQIQKQFSKQIKQYHITIDNDI